MPKKQKPDPKTSIWGWDGVEYEDTKRGFEESVRTHIEDTVNEKADIGSRLAFKHHGKPAGKVKLEGYRIEIGVKVKLVRDDRWDEVIDTKKEFYPTAELYRLMAVAVELGYEDGIDFHTGNSLELGFEEEAMAEKVYREAMNQQLEHVKWSHNSLFIEEEE